MFGEEMILELFVTFGTLKGSFDIEILDLKIEIPENDSKLIPQKVNLKALHKKYKN